MGKMKREPGSPSDKDTPSRLGKHPKKKSFIIFSDPLLIPRINKYLASRKSQVFIDVNDLVNDLQTQYREYSRRKRSAFKPLVEEAFSCILEYSNASPSKRKQTKAPENSTESPVNNLPTPNEPSSSPGKRKKTSANRQLLNLYGANSGSQNKPESATQNKSESASQSKSESAPQVEEASSSANLPCDPPDPNEPSTSTGITRKNSASRHLTNLYNSNSANRKQVKVINSNSNRPELIEISSGDESVVKSEQKLIDEELKKLRLLREAMGRRASEMNRQAAEMNRQAAELFGDEVRRQQRAHRSGADIMPRLLKRQRVPEVKVTFADFASDTKFLEDLCRLILHIPHPEIYRRIGVQAPCGILLHGPPGCGKTLLAHAIAGEMDVELIQVSGPELIGGVSGESEQRIRELFDRAYEKRPCVLFIDEVDTITLNREMAQKEMEKRIVAQLLTCLDTLTKKRGGDRVLVIGATNRPDSLDPALRRAGRFDREVSLGIPDVKMREKILRVLCSKLKLGQDFSFEELAQNTPGFVGADLLSLTREASMVALNRIFAALEAFQARQERNKRRRLERDSSASSSSDDDDENDEEREEESDDGLPEILAQNIVLLRQAREAINQNRANEQHSLLTRMGLGRPLDVEAGEGPSNRVDANAGNGTSDEVAVIDLIQSQEERAVNENRANEMTEQANGAGEPEVAVIDVEEDVKEVGTNEKTTPPEEEGSSSSAQTEEAKPATEEKPNPEGHDEGSDIEVVDPEPGVGQEQGQAQGQGQGQGEGQQDGQGPSPQNQDNNPQANRPDELLAGPSLAALIAWLHDRTPLTCRYLRDICITQDDFRCALRSVQPSAKREGFATVPDVTWDDIGSLAHVRDELKLSILAPVQFRRQFELLGLRGPAGVLICGPPGCGKTLLAKAVANEAGINFISVKGPELLNMYVGESERAVRRCFQRARNSAPCVIFFDELDALCPRRSEYSENGASRVVNQLLTEMDGVEDRQEVYLMAATNRPDIIDPAVLRPGRLDKIIYVGLPEEEDRVDILRAVTRNGTRPRLDPDVNLEEIARRPECVGFSGADLAALVREAGIQAVQDYIATHPNERNDDDLIVGVVHFERALQKIRPSVSPEDRAYYEAMKKRYQPGRP